MANPFRDLREITREVENYLKKNRTAIYQNAKRISDFFEMACYNNIVRFYENNGYDIIVKNLIKGKFNYKCTTAGNPDNYSYFEASIQKRNIRLQYHIRHNINIQSFHNNNTYTTPDISIIIPDSIVIDDDFYDSKMKYYYVENKNLITFCEVKNFNPFPELIFNFIGVVNELKPSLLKIPKKVSSTHISTSLLISGKANKHSNRIIENLQARYHINIIDDLFNIAGFTFGKYAKNRLKTI